MIAMTIDVLCGLFLFSLLWRALPVRKRVTLPPLSLWDRCLLCAVDEDLAHESGLRGREVTIDDLFPASLMALQRVQESIQHHPVTWNGLMDLNQQASLANSVRTAYGGIGLGMSQMNMNAMMGLVGGPRFSQQQMNQWPDDLANAVALEQSAQLHIRYPRGILPDMDPRAVGVDFKDPVDTIDTPTPYDGPRMTKAPTL